MKCCSCNSSGRCVQCSCVRAKRRCYNCTPGQHERCNNAVLPGTQPAGGSQPSSRRTSFPCSLPPLSYSSSCPSSSSSLEKTTSTTPGIGQRAGASKTSSNTPGNRQRAGTGKAQSAPGIGQRADVGSATSLKGENCTNSTLNGADVGINRDGASAKGIAQEDDDAIQRESIPAARREGHVHGDMV